MLERRKEESEAIGRYQGMLVAFILGAIVVWSAPWIMVFVFDLDDESDLFTPPTSSSNSTKGLPTVIAAKVEDVYNLGIWLVRIILLLGVLIAVTMLRLRPGGTVARMTRHAPPPRSGTVRTSGEFGRATPRQARTAC